MKQTDEQIIATIRKILDVLHDPETGFNAFRKKLQEQHLEENEFKQTIKDKEWEIAGKYGFTKGSSESEAKFRISGKDVMDNHLYVSCGQAAKAFCYVNSTLPKDEQLDLMVLFSTDTEHLIDAQAGHTLPCVKLSDGKLHAIEPQIQPEKDKQPGFQFVCDDVRVDGEIWHQLESIKAKHRPYQITKIVTPEEHATIYSDFGKFLEATMVHKGKAAFLFAELKMILQNVNSKKHEKGRHQIYEICKALPKNNSDIQVLVFNKEKRTSYKLVTKLDGIYYEIQPGPYLCLIKANTIDDFHFSEPGYQLQRALTPSEYVQEYEQHNTLTNMTNKERQ